MDKILIKTVFRDASRVGRKHFFSFLILGLLAYAPYIYRAFSFDGKPFADPTIEFQVLTLVLSQLLVGVVAFGTITSLKGRPTSLFKMINIGIIRMFPIVAVGLISSIALFAMTIAPILFVPAIVATIILYPAIPVAVAEQPGIIDALRRSAELSYGRRWQIFYIVLIQVLVMLVGSEALTLLLGDQTTTPTLPYLVSVLGLQIVLGTVGALLTGVTYFHLANRKTLPIS